LEISHILGYHWAQLPVASFLRSAFRLTSHENLWLTHDKSERRNRIVRRRTRSIMLVGAGSRRRAGMRKRKEDRRTLRLDRRGVGGVGEATGGNRGPRSGGDPGVAGVFGLGRRGEGTVPDPRDGRYDFTDNRRGLSRTPASDSGPAPVSLPARRNP